MSASMKTLFTRLLLSRQQILAKKLTNANHNVASTRTIHEKFKFRNKNEKENENYIESKEDFKHVEKILSSKLIPEPPKHTEYPTPSGWFPPTEESKTLPYYIHRTKFHQMPVYLYSKNAYIVTTIKNVDGDIQQLREDLKTYLFKRVQKTVLIQADEIKRHVVVKGDHTRAVVEYMKEKGF